MKKFTLLAAAMIVVSFGYAQKMQSKDVPAAVQSGLQKQYPKATGVKWEKEDTHYEAEFELAETEYSIVLTGTGEIVETEIEIHADALPEGVKTYVAKQYTGQKIKEAAKITDAQGAITYEVELKGKELILDATGNLVKEEVKKHD